MGFAPARRAASEPDDRDVKETFDLYPNGKPCFYCGEILRDALDDHTVFWSGQSKDYSIIFLHPRRAIELGNHLIKDGMIGESATVLGNKPPWHPGWTERTALGRADDWSPR